MRAGTRFENFLSLLVASSVNVPDELMRPNKVVTCHIALVALNSTGAKKRVAKLQELFILLIRA